MQYSDNILPVISLNVALTIQIPLMLLQSLLMMDCLLFNNLTYYYPIIIL